MAWSLATNIKGPAGAKGDTGNTGAAGVAPTGAEMMWPVATPPAGWLIEDGSSQLIAGYPALSALIRGTYGGADGTHFYLPDMRGRVPVGADSEFALNTAGGEKTHTLTVAEMPAHHHSQMASYAVFGAGNYAGAPGGGLAETGINNTGGGVAHNNLQPFRIRNFVIKT